MCKDSYQLRGKTIPAPLMRIGMYARASMWFLRVKKKIFSNSFLKSTQKSKAKKIFLPQGCERIYHIYFERMGEESRVGAVA